MENAESQFEWIKFQVKDEILGSDRTLDIPIVVKNIQSSKRRFRIDVVSEFKQVDKLVEWFLAIQDQKTKNFTLSPIDTIKVEDEFDVDARKERKLVLQITSPKGGYQGDAATFKVTIQSEDGIHKTGGQFTVKLNPVIMALKTTVGNEYQVSKDLERQSEKDKQERLERDPSASNEVLAIMSPFEVKGYIFAETMHPDRVSFIAKGIKGYKGSVDGDIKLEEIEHYLKPKPAVTGLELGAFVELIDGPFKGEKAKIVSIDSNKEEVTVQLVESMVPIPVTVRAEAIRQLDNK